MHVTAIKRHKLQAYVIMSGYSNMWIYDVHSGWKLEVRLSGRLKRVLTTVTMKVWKIIPSCRQMMRIIVQI